MPSGDAARLRRRTRGPGQSGCAGSETAFLPGDGRGSSACWCQSDGGTDPSHLPPQTVINGRVLVKRGRDLADIHLNPIARHRPAIALGALTRQSRTLEAMLAVLS